MPFGIRSAPEVWQRKMNELIENLRGVEVIADDFLVCDFEILKRKLSRITDSNLAAFLRRARQEFKAKFNENEARLTEVPFIGHVLTVEGVKIDPRKVEAVTKMLEPQKELMCFFGMVQYLSNFCRDSLMSWNQSFKIFTSKLITFK